MPDLQQTRDTYSVAVRVSSRALWVVLAAMTTLTTWMGLEEDAGVKMTIAAGYAFVAGVYVLGDRIVAARRAENEPPPPTA